MKFEPVRTMAVKPWVSIPFAGQEITRKLRNRGMTYWSDGSDRRIFLTADHFLYAIDAATGQLVLTFGEDVPGGLAGRIRPGSGDLDSIRDQSRNCVQGSVNYGQCGEEVVRGYKQLAEVEVAFKTLKHTLDPRPMFHRRADRIQAHVLVCWLALLLISLVEIETEQTWDRIRDELATLSLVRLRHTSGTVTLRTELTTAQRRLFADLDIPPSKRIHETQPPAS